MSSPHDQKVPKRPSRETPLREGEKRIDRDLPRTERIPEDRLEPPSPWPGPPREREREGEL